MRSLCGPAARLEASSCCFFERGLAAIGAEALAYQVFLFLLAPSLDVRRRIARERVPTTGVAAPIARQHKRSRVNLFPWLEPLLTRPAKAGAFAYEKGPDVAQGVNPWFRCY